MTSSAETSCSNRRYEWTLGNWIETFRHCLYRLGRPITLQNLAKGLGVSVEDIESAISDRSGARGSGHYSADAADFDR